MLFQADNHSADSISHESFVDYKQSLKCFKNSYCEIFKEDGLRLIGGANLNSINYCDSSYYYKSIEHADKKKYVLDFPTITEILIKTNIPCARFVRNIKGEKVTFDKASNSYFYVQEFIEGDFYIGNRIQFEQCLNLLLKFRNLDLLSTEVGRESPFLTFYSKNFLPKIEKALLNTTESEFTELVKDNFSLLVELLEKLKATLKKLKLKTSNLHHYDLHPHNLIFKEDELVALVDLESVLRIQKEVCESFALYKLGRKSISKGLLSLDEFKEIANQKGFSLQELKPFIQAEILRRLLLILDLHFVRNNSRWNADFPKHLNSLKEIDLMFN